MSRVKRLIHFRRCHVCGAVTEQVEKIERCGDCGKSIVPFLYFDEERIRVAADSLAQPKNKDGEWIPVVGLGACW